MTSLALDLAVLMAEARRRTGLSRFGDAWFLEPLEVLLASMRDEAELNDMGRAIYGERLITGLVNRLRIRAFVDRNREIADVPVHVAAVIVGLGRSGSTLLHRLMAEAEATTAVQWWETLNPVPLANEAPEFPEERRAMARGAVDAMLAASPDLLAIHPLDPFAADEEVMLLEQSFVSSAPESFMHVPSYARWLATADQTPAYRELREVLQLLAWQSRERAGKRWILKSPHHLTALDTIVSVFPNAKIVMPHRDPVATVVSWCSLVASLSTPNTDRLDLKRIGTHWSDRIRNNLGRFMQARDSYDPARFVDIDYDRLVSQPVATAIAALEAIGVACTSEDRQRLARWMELHARSGRPAHRYGAGDFGLDEAKLREDFDDYRGRFLDPDKLQGGTHGVS
jgi:LPS sulfotransferase NodH